MRWDERGTAPNRIHAKKNCANVGNGGTWGQHSLTQKYGTVAKSSVLLPERVTSKLLSRVNNEVSQVSRNNEQQSLQLCWWQQSRWLVPYNWVDVYSSLGKYIVVSRDKHTYWPTAVRHESRKKSIFFSKEKKHSKSNTSCQQQFRCFHKQRVPMTANVCLDCVSWSTKGSGWYWLSVPF